MQRTLRFIYLKLNFVEMNNVVQFVIYINVQNLFTATTTSTFFVITLYPNQGQWLGLPIPRDRCFYVQKTEPREFIPTRSVECTVSYLAT